MGSNTDTRQEFEHENLMLYVSKGTQSQRLTISSSEAYCSQFFVQGYSSYVQLLTQLGESSVLCKVTPQVGGTLLSLPVLLILIFVSMGNEMKDVEFLQSSNEWGICENGFFSQTTSVLPEVAMGHTSIS